MIRQLIAPIFARLNLLRYPVVLPYLIIGVSAAFIFGLLGMFDRYLTTLEVLMHLSVLVIAGLIIGMLFLWVFEKKLFADRRVLVRSWILITTIIWGMVIFALTSPFIGWRNSRPVYLSVYWPALLVAALPWFFWRAVIALTGVPQLRFTPLVFDSLKDVLGSVRFTEGDKGIRWKYLPDPTTLDDTGQYIYKTFLPKNPQDYTLAHLFKSIISFHNITDHPEKPIIFKNFAWEFYYFPYWFWPLRKRYLNPAKSLQPERFRFIKVPKEERERSQAELPPDFRAATIYITRSKIS